MGITGMAVVLSLTETLLKPFVDRGDEREQDIAPLNYVRPMKWEGGLDHALASDL